MDNIKYTIVFMWEGKQQVSGEEKKNVKQGRKGQSLGC